MNKKRRLKLNEASQLMSRAKSIVEGVCYEEQDAMDNMPENLQESDRYTSMEDAVDEMNDATEKMDDAIALVQSAASKRF